MSSDATFASELDFLEFSGPLARAFAQAVDPEFYEFLYGKLAPGTAAAVHYAILGWREGRDPNPWFCTRRYVEAHPGVAQSGTVPLFAFLQRGPLPEGNVQPCEHARAYFERPAARVAFANGTQDNGDAEGLPELAEQYRVVQESFDAGYYLAENPQLAKAAIDPLLHFLLQGWNEGRDPTAWFSLSGYVDAYPDVARSRINPFYHFLSVGRAEGRTPKLGRDKFDPNYYLDTNPDVARAGKSPLSHFLARGWREGRAPNAFARVDFLAQQPDSASIPAANSANSEYVLDALGSVDRVCVIIPIHDTLENLETCLDALFDNTTYPVELLLIDDATRDNVGAQVLARYQDPRIRVLRNETKLGFSASVNCGLRESRHDVVVLSCNAAVGPRWLENLIAAACRRPSIGIVTAMSNGDGSNLSDLSREQRNAVARLIAQRSHNSLPETPAARGTCTLVKRRAIEEVGALDGGIFAQEAAEADYSMRARDAGWEHVIDDATLVFRTESGISNDRAPRGLSLETEPIAGIRRPEYRAYAQRFADGPRFAALKKWAAGLPILPVLDGTLRVAPRVLYVVHGWGLGGTMEFCLDLVRGLGTAIDGYILSSSGDRLALYVVEADGLRLVESHDLLQRTLLADVRNVEYRNAIFNILSKHHFELVHIHHLMEHTLDIFDVTKRLNVPTVVTCHDYYLVCPSYLLLDDDFNFCDGVCTPGAGSCTHGSPWLLAGPPLKHQWVHAWRQRVTQALRGVDALTVPSHDAEQRYRRLLPEANELPLFVIEHGVDLERVRAAEPPVPGKTVRILFPGNIGTHKGLDRIAALHAADTGGRLELHFMGKMPKSVENYGFNHGEYRRTDFVELVAGIKPAFVGIFSIVAETFCYVLSEAWLAGVPVIGTQLGAVGQRIAREKGGWTFDMSDIEGLYRGILAIADDPAEYARGLKAAQSAKVRSVREMQADYFDVYRQLMHRRAIFPMNVRTRWS